MWDSRLRHVHIQVEIKITLNHVQRASDRKNHGAGWNLWTITLENETKWKQSCCALEAHVKWRELYWIEFEVLFQCCDFKKVVLPSWASFCPTENRNPYSPLPRYHSVICGNIKISTQCFVFLREKGVNKWPFSLKLELREVWCCIWHCCLNTWQ